MTKQELLDKYIPCQCWPAKDGGKTYNVSCPQHSQDPETAMDEYAEIEAILFAEWIDGQQLECYLMTDEGEKLWQYMFPKGSGKESFTTSQLFQLFKTQQTKTS